ncbi:MAG: hypothetical protein ACRDG6_12005 [Candidatus Limnocylindria bacterium]
MKRRGARQPPYPLRPRQNRGALAVTAAFSVAIVALLGIFPPPPVEVVIWSSQEKFELLSTGDCARMGQTMSPANSPTAPCG